VEVCHLTTVRSVTFEFQRSFLLDQSFEKQDTTRERVSTTTINIKSLCSIIAQIDEKVARFESS
jgi:hypothetical protein